MLETIFVDKMAWPPKGSAYRLLHLARYNQLFENEQDAMRNWVKELRRARDEEHEILKEFVAYPAPEVAARTLSSFLFGENALITSEEVQDQIDEFIEDNHLHALNQEAALTCVIEGEVFYKVDWDEEISPDNAIISAIGGAMSFPYFKFGRLIEIAFVVNLTEDPGATTIYRHVEIRQKGKIIHKLFKGSKDSLGKETTLDKQSYTSDFQELVNDEGELETEVDDLLVRHAPLWRTSKSPHGISIFRAKEGLIEGIHALYTQDQHDAEMTKKRIAVASNYLARDKRTGKPKFDRTTDVFELSEEAMGAIGASVDPVHAIDFTDATTQGQRIAQRLDEFLLACGIAPQSAGRNVAGAAESGTARRLAQTLTLQTVATAGRYFMPALRDVIEVGLTVGNKHLSVKVPDTYELKVELQDGLSLDLTETASQLANITTAKAASTEVKVKMLHPDWGDKAVQEEVKRILDEEGMSLPSDFGNPPPTEPAPGDGNPNDGSGTGGNPPAPSDNNPGQGAGGEGQ